jgi:hypothetical protein
MPVWEVPRQLLRAVVVRTHLRGGRTGSALPERRCSVRTAAGHGVRVLFLRPNVAPSRRLPDHGHGARAMSRTPSPFDNETCLACYKRRPSAGKGGFCDPCYRETPAIQKRALRRRFREQADLPICRATPGCAGAPMGLGKPCRACWEKQPHHATSSIGVSSLRSLRFPAGHWALARTRAAQEGISASEWVRRAIAAALARPTPEAAPAEGAASPPPVASSPPHTARTGDASV